jgi:hypothetical protein
MVGLGIIARDSSRIVVASMYSFHLYVSYSSVAEAMGARQGAEFGRFLYVSSFSDVGMGFSAGDSCSSA